MRIKNQVVSIILTFLICNISFAGEKDMYNFSWLDPGKEVYVLQNRKFRKVDKVYLNFGLGLTTSGAFADGMLAQIRAGYFFKENWGIELLYSYNSGEENDTGATVRGASGGSGVGSIPFRRITDSYMGGMLVWSPFYTKINTFNKVVYTDITFGIGLASLTETNNDPEFTSGNIGQVLFEQETHMGLIWDFSWIIYLTQHWHARASLTTIHYKAEGPTSLGSESEFDENWDAVLSLGYRF